VASTRRRGTKRTGAPYDHAAIAVPMAHPLNDTFAEHVPAALQRPSVARFFGIPQVVEMLESMGGEPSFERGLHALGASVHVEGLENLPEGPVVVAPNHPFAMIDVLATGAAVERRRPPGTVKAVVDRASASLVELHPLMLFVGDDAQQREAFWEEAHAHLASGGVVVMFPAGHSVKRARDGVALETPWRAGCLKLAARAGAALVPTHVHAPSRRRYQLLRRHLDRLVVQKLNLREAVRFRSTARVRFGTPIPVDGCTPDILRQRVYAVGRETFRV